MGEISGKEMVGWLIFRRKLAIKGAIFGGLGVGWGALVVAPP